MNYSAQVEALPLWCPPRLESAWRDLEQRRCIWVRLQRWRQVKKCLIELDAIYNLATISVVSETRWRDGLPAIQHNGSELDPK